MIRGPAVEDVSAGLSRKEAIAPACSSSIHRASNAVEPSEKTGDESPYHQDLSGVSGSAEGTRATASVGQNSSDRFPGVNKSGEDRDERNERWLAPEGRT